MAGAFSLLRLFPNLMAGCSIRMRMSWPRRLRSWRGVSYKVLDSYVRGVISRARRRFRRWRSAPTSETRSLISISSRCAGIGIFCGVYGLLGFRTRPAESAESRLQSIGGLYRGGTESCSLSDLLGVIFPIPGSTEPNMTRYKLSIGGRRHHLAGCKLSPQPIPAPHE